MNKITRASQFGHLNALALVLFNDCVQCLAAAHSLLGQLVVRFLLATDLHWLPLALHQFLTDLCLILCQLVTQALLVVLDFLWLAASLDCLVQLLCPVHTKLEV